MSWIQSLVSGGLDRPGRAGTPVFSAPIAPDTPFYAIGDVHGRLDALESLLVRIETQDPDPQVICVGDYIDRGEDSANVLRWLHRLNTEFGETFVCLKGNHELMCLRFFEDPETHGDRWFRHGGLQTLSSFNVTRGPDTSHTDVRDQLYEAMGEPLITWMAQLPLHWQNGNIIVVHAAADPTLPVNIQSEDVLCWGHSEFNTVPRVDGNWIVHGHTIVDQPRAVDGRISLDTGAYATGTLTAAYITPEGVSFLTS